MPDTPYPCLTPRQRRIAAHLIAKGFGNLIAQIDAIPDELIREQARVYQEEASDVALTFVTHILKDQQA